MELRPLSSYVRELRSTLPAEVFAPARSRILWMPVHLAVIATVTWLVGAGHVPDLELDSDAEAAGDG